jgi:hypothetical protein
MKASDFRQWLFEIVAILLPGGIVLVIIAQFAAEPQAFILRIRDLQYVSQFPKPFDSALANTVAYLGLGFVAGHIVQQIAVYLMKIYTRIFRLSHRNLIDQIFSSPQIREYLIPSRSGLDCSGLGLKNYDYFMMIYPDMSPHTKRDTFIAISGFCGSMAVVTILLVLLIAASSVARTVAGKPALVLSLLISILIGSLITFLWIKRCTYFYDMADRMVVDYFLSKFGHHFRERLRTDNSLPTDKN